MMKTKKRPSRKSALSKSQWIQKYSDLIYQSWLYQAGLFEVDGGYIEQIKTELKDDYSNPLKKEFIEHSYF